MPQGKYRFKPPPMSKRLSEGRRDDGEANYVGGIWAALHAVKIDLDWPSAMGGRTIGRNCE